jgi:urea transporter
MNSLTRHAQEYFKAISQAFFFRNAYFGFAVLVLFLVFDRYSFICGVSGSLVGYVYSVRYSTPKLLRDWGLITINGLFFGIAMASLFQMTPILIVCVVIGALSIPLFTKSCFEVLQHWKLSPVVAPYLFTVWMIWLSGRQLALQLKPMAWPELIATLPSQHPQWSLGLRLCSSTLEGMGRLLFLPNPLFGLALLLLILSFSPRRAIYFLLGTASGTIVSYLMSRNSFAWEYGYFNYSAGLVGLGLASFPQMFASSTILLFCVLSCFMTMAAEQILGLMHLPALSVPYVVTMWFAMLSRIPRVSVSWSTSNTRYQSPFSVAKNIASVHPRELEIVDEKAS